jgi:hypothetical protein
MGDRRGRAREPSPRRGIRGAVLAEFIIAFMPICAMFLCVCQLSRLAIARLVVMHAAEVSVRACAVIYDPDPGHDAKLDGPDSDVQTAAHMVMQSFGGGPNGSDELTITDPTCNHSGEANGGTDTVKISADYHCTIPLAEKIVCSKGDHYWTTQAQFPHQGAEYKLK